MQNYEDKIYYSLGEAVTEQTQAISQAVQKTLENNGGVGIMTGYYDQNLSILSVSNLLLHSTGHTFDTFMEQTKGSLKNFFYDKEDILERDRFLQLHGTGEAQILTADAVIFVLFYSIPLLNLPHKRSLLQSQSEIDQYGSVHFYGLTLAFAVGYSLLPAKPKEKRVW